MGEEPGTATGEPGEPAIVAEEATRQRFRNPHFYRRLHARLHSNPVIGLVTKVVVTTVGCLVLLAGLIMMVTPGPGLLGIAVGLGILATEWDWADRWMKSAKAKARYAAERAREVDPAVRRRRIALGISAVLVVAIVVVTYVVIYDWPGFVRFGWGTMQDIAPFVPDLPTLELP